MSSRSAIVGPSYAVPARSVRYATTGSSTDVIVLCARAIPMSIEVTDFVSENSWNRAPRLANLPG
jgi:hypothetical protein